MKKLLTSVLALALLASLLVMPAQAAGTETPYFVQHGIPVMQTRPTELEVPYLACNLEGYYNEKVTKSLEREGGSFEVTGYEVVPSKTPGYKNVTLTTKCRLMKSNNPDGEKYYNYANCAIWFYDYYTGKFFPITNLADEDEDLISNVLSASGYHSYTDTLAFQGEECPIYYHYRITTNDDFEKNSEGTVANAWTDEPLFAYQEQYRTIIFRVPDDYDGLVYAIGGAKDLPTDYAANNGTRYFRFGRETADGKPIEEEPVKKVPLSGTLDIHFGNGQCFDDMMSFDYTLTNGTEQTINGPYALLVYYTHYASKGGGVFAEVFPIDVNLQSGESTTDTLEAFHNVKGLTEYIWIKFDDQAERDEFFSDRILYKIYNSYTVNFDKGDQWLKDNFGITLIPRN